MFVLCMYNYVKKIHPRPVSLRRGAFFFICSHSTQLPFQVAADVVDMGVAHLCQTLGGVPASCAGAADVAMKSADVQIGFMDRFCGSLILTGGLSEVETAVEEVVRFFGEALGFQTCAVHKN